MKILGSLIILKNIIEYNKNKIDIENKINLNNSKE